MDIHSLFRILLNFQNAIHSGSVTISVGEDSFTLTREDVIMDIHDPEKMRKLMAVISPLMGSEEDDTEKKKKMINSMQIQA